MNKFDFKYKLKPLSDLLLSIGNRIRPRLANIYEEPYSTHIPILIALSSIIDVKSVLEIGSGLYSTGSFLNRTIFPNIIKLESYEDDQSWAELVRNKFGNDTRLQLNVVNPPMYNSVKRININQFDIIIIDDSQNAPDRSRTIIEICKKRLNNKILLIHDFEIEPYRKARKYFRHYFTFYSYTPCTGVLWNNGLKYSQLCNLLSTIDQNKQNLKTTDIEGWLQLFKISQM